MIWATVSSWSCFCWQKSFSIFGCKEYNQSNFGIDYLVMSTCRVFSSVDGKGFLLWSVHFLVKTLLAFDLWSITNKGRGGDGIPVELFQILKDDVFKVLHSKCQQIWKTQQWPQDWKRSVFIAISKKGNAKECSNYRTIVLILHASKVMLRILQARLQQYVNRELLDVQAGFRKGRGTRDQIANSCCCCFC